jgi:hypothetical protein
VIREMILYGLRWPIERAGSDPDADAFFAVLVRLVADALEDEAPLSLPTSEDPVVAAALVYTRDHLASVSAAAVSRAAGVSERTLRRQFRSELNMSWRACFRPASFAAWPCWPSLVPRCFRCPPVSASTARAPSPGPS